MLSNRNRKIKVEGTLLANLNIKVIGVNYQAKVQNPKRIRIAVRFIQGKINCTREKWPPTMQRPC